ncbi:hypothetical protein [Burkholderia phage BCSR5]|nr:hypothetical protein [Burkholderia phage BCSR5]
MPAVVRVGDLGFGICYGHDTPQNVTVEILTGADTVTTNGQPTGFVSSIGIASCGHTTEQLIGSENTFAMGPGVSRVGDMGQTSGPGNYEMMTGSDDTFCN